MVSRAFHSIVGGAALATLVLSVSAFAAPADKAWLACRSDKVAVSIAGCTTVIGRGDKEKPADRAIAFYNRGNGFFNKGDVDKAIADYTESLALNPDFANAHFNRGNGYSNKGDLDHAIADYDAAIKLDPGFKFAFFNRGNAFFNKGDFDRAIVDYTAALRIDPAAVPVLINRGNALRSKGEFEPALADYDAALKLDPKNKLAAANRDKAIADRAAAKAKAPEPTTAVATKEPPPVAEPALASRGEVGAETRVALVIGNSKYAAVASLPNPPRDADAVAAALRGDGFSSVTVIDDVTRSQFLDALNAFADKAASADWAVVYFAGHGIEIDGVNYLVPVDAALKTDRSVEDEAISLDRVIGAVEAAKKLRLVILDACRDNPFVPSMRLTVASRSIHRGLARIEPAGGTLVAYAAKGGEEAIDGDGTANSPFAAALVGRLATPGLEVGKLFRLVRDDVLKATGQKQEPFVYGSLPGEDLFFRPK